MKKLFSFLAVFILVCSVTPVMAAGERLVNDEAGVLTAEQAAELEARLAGLADAYDFDPVIVFTADSGTDIVSYSDDYFDYNGYGRGENRSGILMAVDVTRNKRYLSTCGDCISAYTDKVIAYIGTDLAKSADAREYYELSVKFADYADKIMNAYRTKGRFNVPYKLTNQELIIVAIISLVIALIAMSKAKKSTIEAITPVNADIYAEGGSARITAARDMFLYSNITKTRRSEEKSGGGGSSTHTSSSGTTHGGGSF